MKILKQLEKELYKKDPGLKDLVSEGIEELRISEMLRAARNRPTIMSTARRNQRCRSNVCHISSEVCLGRSALQVLWYQNTAGAIFWATP